MVRGLIHQGVTTLRSTDLLNRNATTWVNRPVPWRAVCISIINCISLSLLIKYFLLLYLLPIKWSLSLKYSGSIFGVTIFRSSSLQSLAKYWSKPSFSCEIAHYGIVQFLLFRRFSWPSFEIFLIFPNFLSHYLFLKSFKNWWFNSYITVYY